MSKFILPTTLKELRFHLSQTGEKAVPLKTFLTLNYPTLKSQLKYRIPILIRESYGIPSSVTARFEKGREIKVSLDGLDEQGITDSLQQLLKGA